jgi:Alginate lyase
MTSRTHSSLELFAIVTQLSVLAGCSSAGDPRVEGAGGSSATGGDGTSSGGKSAGGASVSGTTGGGSATGGGLPTGGSGGGSGAGQIDAGIAHGDSGPSGAHVPGEFLDLSNWYLTLPTGMASKPDDVFQPALSTFKVDPWFTMSPGGDAIQFRANAGGVTTSGSSYPRSELREMTNQGMTKADWSTGTGKHTMITTLAVTQLTPVKPDVVVNQIHNAADDVVEIHLTKQRLFVKGSDPTAGKGTSIDHGTLDPAYVMGTYFTTKIVAENGTVSIYYNDMTKPVITIPNLIALGCYFKAGSYPHSTPNTGDAPTAYGEALFKQISVTHE